jgi:Intron-binding protein aquarius N-terminus
MLCTRHCDSPLTGLPDEALLDLARRLRLVPAEAAVADSGGGSSSSSSSSVRRSLLLQTLVNHFAERPSQLQRVNEMPLVPSEALLWDENQVTRQTVIFSSLAFLIRVI